MTRRGSSAVARFKAAIVSRVNHELRAPLTVATMAYELLCAQAGDAATKADYRRLLGNALLRLRERLSDPRLLDPQEPPSTAARRRKTYEP